MKIGIRRFSEKQLWELPKDDVFPTHMFKKIRYTLEDAIQCHRETLHPTTLNKPDALLTCRVELDMRLRKQNKYVSGFDGILTYPNMFEYKRNRRIVAICKSPHDQEIATNAGAIMAGSTDLIKMIKTKTLTKEHFDHIVSHTDMIIPLSEIRGVLKEHFPNKIRGNFGTDMDQLVKKFVEGIDFQCVKDDYEKDYAWVEAIIGRLNMNIEQLQQNLSYFLERVEDFKPKEVPAKDYNGLISRVLLRAEGSKEKFVIRFWEHINGYEQLNVEQKKMSSVM